MKQQHSSSKHSGFCGWDIGGAHLKVARCDHNGRLLQVIQYPCALWRGIEELSQSLKQAIAELGCEADCHAVTMTGELVDAFVNRQQGVEAIVDCFTQHIPVEKCQIFAGQKGWLGVEQAKLEWQAVASMNWQASAMYAAGELKSGLFIDIGSTTCDIVPFHDHRIQPCGLDDHHRQRDGSLVYTGAIRTPLMAVTDKAPLNGYFVPLTAEWFASTGDIWCLLGKLEQEDIQDQSADGLPWTIHHSRQRLARMLATDAEMAADWQWQHVAKWFAEKQYQKIIEACLQVMAASPQPEDSPIVGAGVGRFIIKACADRLNRPYIDYSELCDHAPSAADHAPATALALLAQRQLS